MVRPKPFNEATAATLGAAVMLIDTDAWGKQTIVKI
jgi:hypothetical protein